MTYASSRAISHPRVGGMAILLCSPSAWNARLQSVSGFYIKATHSTKFTIFQDSV